MGHAARVCSLRTAPVHLYGVLQRFVPRADGYYGHYARYAHRQQVVGNQGYAREDSAATSEVFRAPRLAHPLLPVIIGQERAAGGFLGRNPDFDAIARCVHDVHVTVYRKRHASYALAVNR
jgi:hypothetical protein